MIKDLICEAQQYSGPHDPKTRALWPRGPWARGPGSSVGPGGLPSQGPRREFPDLRNGPVRHCLTVM